MERLGTRAGRLDGAALPQGGQPDERLRRADRRWFWREAPVGLAFVAVELLADRDDKRRQLVGSGPVQAWQVGLWIAAGIVLVVSITIAVRRRMRTGMWRSWVLDGLTREQRRELEAEVRGERPIVPGDEPALRQIGRRWSAAALDACFAAGFMLAVLPIAIADPSGWVGAFRLAVLAYVGAGAVLALIRASAGRRYLRRSGVQ